MRDRLRNLDSKITFFAFADIITAVSGMLIFITLLLATDLGRPTDSRSQAANAELDRQLQETLAQQAEADAKNRGLQNILTTVNTASAPDKLESDISRLRTELAQEKSKHADLAEQLAASKSNLEERDKVLGITGIRAHIAEDADLLKALTQEDAKVRDATSALENQVKEVQARFAKLQNREGQLWLVPERSSKTKEALLVIVGGNGAQIERFNHPDQTLKLDKRGAHDGFESFLKKSKSTSQYFVFLIRPSGIGLFKDLVQVARDQGFEVGFDALEEGTEVHFTPAPPMDNEATTAKRPENRPGPRRSNTGSPGGTGTDASEESGADISITPTNAAASSTNVTITNTPPSLTNTASSITNATASSTNTTPSTPPPPPSKPKSWWQRFLEWIGIG
jgi:hypothetical protein